MIPAYRQWFNKNFTEEKYHSLLNQFEKQHPGALDFRIAETPVFIDEGFKNKMLAACESIVDVVTNPNFKSETERAIPTTWRVPGDDGEPHFIAFDFGICINKDKELEPQLIEMQGFATLFAYQCASDKLIRETFHLPGELTSYLNGFDAHTYKELLRDIMVADCKPEETILLEIFPHKQKTRIDFVYTQELLGIQPVCVTEIIQEGRELFYMRNERKTKIRRIFNRVIFDELEQQSDEVKAKAAFFFNDVDVTWVTHPNWFYRISKFTLPYIQHDYVPATSFLSDIKTIPGDLENYVLKPLFSFAGQGVIIDVTKADIENITDPQNWILQRKVEYAAVIPTPDNEPSKAEIRIFYFWKDGEARPVAAHNLARLSKGKMIGTRYNKDKTWVGGSICYFEQA
ncbi:MAG: hypothetical protein J0I41_22105 [Filimonas sp.]|nr:hypothetical protein [Filimonas sp.]